jgi:hypothetical protein
MYLFILTPSDGLTRVRMIKNLDPHKIHSFASFRVCTGCARKPSGTSRPMPRPLAPGLCHYPMEFNTVAANTGRFCSPRENSKCHHSKLCCKRYQRVSELSGGARLNRPGDWWLVPELSTAQICLMGIGEFCQSSRQSCSTSVSELPPAEVDC